MEAEWAMALKAALKTGNWVAAIEHLKGSAYAPPMKLDPETMRERFMAGACVGCGRDPCGHCDAKGPMFCEVCWNTIERSKPEGLVVSGLARVMQQISMKDRGALERDMFDAGLRVAPAPSVRSLQDERGKEITG